MHLFIKKRSYLLMVDDDTNCNNITFSSECVKLETHKISTITIRTKQWSLGPGLGNLKVQIFGRNLLGLNWLMKSQPSSYYLKTRSQYIFFVCVYCINHID
jgi:hypothetical protein